MAYATGVPPSLPHMPALPITSHLADGMGLTHITMPDMKGGLTRPHNPHPPSALPSVLGEYRLGVAHLHYFNSTMATNTDENTVLAAIQAARNAKQALSEIDDELTMHYDLASLSPRRHAAAATEYTAWEVEHEIDA